MQLISRYVVQFKHLRFWQRLANSFFAAVGLMSFTIGIFGLLYPDFFKAKWWIVAGVAAIALLWSLWTGRPSLPFQRYSFNADVRLVTGDILEQDDANVLIGMSSTFDTNVADGIISRNSVQGQFLERIYGGSVQNLDRDLDAALAAASGPVGTISKPGKQDVYPIGTVATLSATNGKKYFCVAYTDMDAHNVANGSIQGVLDSLNAVWDECDRRGNGAPICVAMIGQGLARVPELTAEISIRLIAFSFLLRSRRRRFSSELRIVLTTEGANQINMQEFQAFLTSVAQI
ncbi:macro domain-containing protein [Nocardia brasiliensis]|uniref:macro domain-containing protein n=1 Tax=Nocardia brasiliensis TaxID=37326 RepID=UPI0024537DAF|nr:macro domain-containing protein [Nocardia brasiliensis]